MRTVMGIADRLERLGDVARRPAPRPAAGAGFLGGDADMCEVGIGKGSPAGSPGRQLGRPVQPGSNSPAVTDFRKGYPLAHSAFARRQPEVDFDQEGKIMA